MQSNPAVEVTVDVEPNGQDGQMRLDIGEELQALADLEAELARAKAKIEERKASARKASAKYRSKNRRPARPSHEDLAWKLAAKFVDAIGIEEARLLLRQCGLSIEITEAV